MGEAIKVLKVHQVPDPYGSRCRNASGQWTATDFCPPFPTDLKPADPQRPAETMAVSADGVRKYLFEHRAVEASSLITSHNAQTFAPNPAFTQKLQPRLRDRAAAELQVRRIAAQLSPDALLTDFHTLDRGAPIVGPDLLVESGNGRTMGLVRAASEHPENYAAYRTALEARSAEFGLDSLAIRRMRHPALVRVRLTPLNDQERQAFVQEANTPSGISRSAIEQARTDAERITLDMLEALHVGENESIFDALRTARNAPFVRAALGAIPENERGQLLDAKGAVNQDGVRRIAQAVFVATFGSGEAGLRLGEMAFESADQDVRNIFNAVSRSLVPMAKAEGLVRRSQRDALLSIGEDLAKTIGVYAKIKNDPSLLTVSKYLSQSQMFERELSPFQEAMLRVLDANARSPKRLAAILSHYAEAVIQQPPPGQAGLFGDIERPSKEALWLLAQEERELTLVQGALMSITLGYIATKIRWVHVSRDAQRRILEGWPALQRLLVEALSYGAIVTVSSGGFAGDQYQVNLKGGALTQAQKESLRRNASRIGLKEVRSAEAGMLVFLATIPQEAEDLILKPQEGSKKPQEERIDPRLQPALFQEIAVEQRMEQVGRNAWAILHQWADAFREVSQEVSPGCGCGDFAVAAARGLHDAVSVSLGKPAQHPEDLLKLAAFCREAADKLPRDILGDPDLDADGEEDDGEEDAPLAQLPADLVGVVEEVPVEEALGAGIDDDEITLAPSHARSTNAPYRDQFSSTPSEVAPPVTSLQDFRHRLGALMLRAAQDGFDPNVLPIDEVIVAALSQEGWVKNLAGEWVTPTIKQVGSRTVRQMAQEWRAVMEARDA